ncbi:hypothetical protein [Lactobacillus xylocopicola]|uniref:Integral membrane protein n=1 Tax=Lactobacillus xylocopicola TaxID=2976676 RepID=A0ABM8BEZ1_9LACO|nr:hypothetical protein [Lactobacillus xylocopicola]BDR59812.1 hypothetical protein KIM322_00730 [Lactobacillus xylocopicola]
MQYIIAFLVVMLFLMLGEWVSSLTHTYIPSVFLTAALFVIGYWTILPKDIVATASFNTNFSTICVGLLLVHLGTLMSLKELLQQWRAVCIALLGVCGTLILTLTIGTAIFNWHTVVAAIPPLTGGLVSALLMTDGLKAQGIQYLVALPVSMFVLHSLFGYPLISWLLKKEGGRLVTEYQKHPVKEQATNTASTTSVQDKSLFQKLPAKYQTSAFILAKVALIALLSNGFSFLLKNYAHIDLNSNVVCLIFGVLAHQFGFLESDVLNKAGVFNWLMYGLMAYIFAQLSITTPQQMGTIIGQILVLIVLGLLGMLIASSLLAKPFKMTWQMAYACSLTSLCGFPADYIITKEVSHEVAGSKNEEAYLIDHMMPKMLVGGFATVSVASIIIASIFLKLL